uniref:Uncharacterized protein n=1 Tax=Chromera velia CCMP2878 TaxID=1169474 RepID=A0A0G4ICI0_9ALVE|eukprot:Cvel_13125.t1-p1 / transcript=Cvel_13125.t1 / gene=Cvel_13125 / organism=Chromera_velia_CCMP2878 / gene_product=hypothetical protein / transcript_product=hypothetical protein / location=Cvel_scaffold885:9708-12990(+) / protein_length=284 / sequence_SO=supercontig / SO=protein_coding / is_pseudo=false
MTCLLPLAQRNWADKLVKVHEKQIIAYETDPRVRYPAFDRFATGDMLYDWNILDVNHERLQHAPDPERRKAATTFPVGVMQFQKGKRKGNGGAADSAGGGAAPTRPGGRTNLKPKEAAADANAEKARGKLPPPEKVITPGEEGYRPLYIHLQHKELVVSPGAAQRVAELTNSGCLAAQKQDGSNTNSNSKRRLTGAYQRRSSRSPQGLSRHLLGIGRSFGGDDQMRGLDFLHRSHQPPCQSEIQRVGGCSSTSFPGIVPSTLPTGQYNCTTTTFIAHRGSTAAP